LLFAACTPDHKCFLDVVTSWIQSANLFSYGLNVVW
jgi:hypothetical protein